MPVQKIRAYFSLAEQGESTIRERYQMLLEQQESLNEQMRRLAQSQAYISHKLEVYSGYMRETNDTQGGAAQSVPSK